MHRGSVCPSFPAVPGSNLLSSNHWFKKIEPKPNLSQRTSRSNLIGVSELGERILIEPHPLMTFLVNWSNFNSRTAAVGHKTRHFLLPFVSFFVSNSSEMGAA